MYIFNLTIFLFYFQFNICIPIFKLKKQNAFKMYSIMNENINENVNENNEMNNLKNLIDSFDKIDNIGRTEEQVIDETKTKKTEFYKKMKGYDERFCMDLYDLISCKENYYKNLDELKKIYGFLQKQQLLDKLINIIQSKKENETLHHFLELNIINEIEKYNNDNRNTSIFLHNILSGDLYNHW